jgi:DNA-binding transcriptional MerR regulator
MAYITHYYTPDELKIIACDLKANIPVKRIARIRGEQFGRKGDGMLKKIRQIKRSLEKGFTIKEIINKETTETYNKKPEAMKTLKFYTEEEVIIMKTDIATGEPIEQIARRLSKDFDRPIPGLAQKLHILKRDVPFIAKWKGVKRVKPVRSLATIRAKKVLQDKKQEEALQQPAEIGVEVPHGMTFEGKPKKIMLHSDHFRIYF